MNATDGFRIWFIWLQIYLYDWYWTGALKRAKAKALRRNIPKERLEEIESVWKSRIEYWRNNLELSSGSESAYILDLDNDWFINFRKIIIVKPEVVDNQEDV